MFPILNLVGIPKVAASKNCHLHKSREPRVSCMKMLNLIAIGERAGSGVPDIYSVWAAKGWIDPEVEEQFDPDRTILTLAFTKKSGKNKRKGIISKHQPKASG